MAEEFSETIKLKRMSIGYGWEINMFGADKETIDRLKILNDQMVKEYGDEE